MPEVANAVVPFPGRMRSQQRSKRTGEKEVHTFPFTREEVAIIDMHLCERSPEICLDIGDARVREIVERFMVYVWAKRVLLPAGENKTVNALPRS